MSALFTIDQTAKPAGVLGISRADLSSGGITLSCPSAHTTYLWEFFSEPLGSTAATIATPTLATTAATITEVGSYLIKLTVDDGLPTKDVSTLLGGIPLGVSGLAIPAAFETNQDNSLAPHTGERGFEPKLTAFIKWVDANIGGGGSGVFGAGSGTGAALLPLYGDLATGNYSFADGQSNLAQGDYAHAFGNACRALTDYSRAEGNTCLASGGIHALSYGNLSTAAHNYASAFGYGANATWPAQRALAGGMVSAGIAGSSQVTEVPVYGETVDVSGAGYSTKIGPEGTIAPASASPLSIGRSMGYIFRLNLMGFFNNTAAAWVVEFCVANGGVPRIVGTVNYNKFAADAGASSWDVTVNVNTSDSTIEIWPYSDVADVHWCGALYGAMVSEGA